LEGVKGDADGEHNAEISRRLTGAKHDRNIEKGVVKKIEIFEKQQYPKRGNKGYGDDNFFYDRASTVFFGKYSAEI
jgi:phage repressor protein C with HTH and peptisase S24 domain